MARLVIALQNKSERMRIRFQSESDSLGRLWCIEVARRWRRRRRDDERSNLFRGMIYVTTYRAYTRGPSFPSRSVSRRFSLHPCSRSNEKRTIVRAMQRAALYANIAWLRYLHDFALSYESCRFHSPRAPVYLFPVISRLFKPCRWAHL